MPKITVLLCTYRRPQLLARALASLAAQHFPELEVRIFDNASGDETRSVVDWFAAHGLAIRYHCQPENLGFRGNFTFATTRPIESEFVHILNDDDYIFDGFFQTALAGFDRMPEAICSMAQVAHVETSGEVTAIPLARWPTGAVGPGKAALLMLQLGHPELTAMLYRSAWFREVGGFDFDGYGNCCDVPFHVLAAAKHAFVLSPTIGGIYSWHEGQESLLAESDATSVFAGMFARLDRGSFPNLLIFRQVLRAIASRHVYAQRHRTRGPGAAREWCGLQAVFELTRRRPAECGSAWLGYLRALGSTLARLSCTPSARASERLRREVCAAAQRQIAVFALQLAREYVEPCLVAAGFVGSDKSICRK